MIDELKKLRAEAQATIARIDKALADLTGKPTPKRPFRRGEPVIVWDDELYQFIGFFVKTEGSGFVVSNNPDLLHPTTWPCCERLPPFIDWSLVEPHYGYALEYDSGLVTPRESSSEIGHENSYGTVVAVHKRPEETK